MNKQEIIDVIAGGMPGDIFISKGNTLFAKIICWVLKTEYSHTFVKINDSEIIEANDFGTQIVTIEAFAKNCLTVEKLGFPSNDSARIIFLSVLKLLVGRKYDYGILLGGLWSRLVHRSRRLNTPLNDKNAFTCSELVATALTRCGQTFQYPPSQITPEDLYYYMKKLERPDPEG